MRDKGKPGSSPQQITRLWTQQGNWPPTQLQALQQYIFHKFGSLFYLSLFHKFDHFLLLLLLLLFVFISLKHNKLQMIYWGYHNCYGNLELSIDLWFKAKHGFIVNTATDEEKKTLERLGLREQRFISDINILKT